MLRLFFALLLLSIGITSCDSSKSGIPVPDTSGIDLGDIQFVRFDHLVMQMDTTDIKDEYTRLLTRYPNFTDLYFKQLLEFQSNSEDSFYQSIKNFISAELIINLQDTIDYVYPDTKQSEEQIREGFSYLKYYFPAFPLPNVYFFQSEFSYQNVLFSDNSRDGIGIGLDLFLGEHFDYKVLDPRNPVFSEYLARTYNRDHIPRKVLYMLVDELTGPPNGKRFIDQIVHNGKKLYILKHLMPESQDSVIMEFTPEQLNWLENNELEMWSYFLEEEFFYETNQMKIDKYLNHSPHSPGMPPQAPGRTGTFIGLKIVEAYMKKYPETSLKELIELRDAQKLVEMAKYKPKRR